jgi:addiction module RelB/DinJ family antitoxin
MPTAAKTLITLKTDKKLKLEAQKTAEKLGLPLGTVINGFLRQFVRDQAVTFSAGLTPTPHLKKILDQTQKDIRDGKVTGPRFSNAEDAVAYLRSQR